MNKNKKAVLFARVSTKEQADKGYSLDSQIKLLKNHAEKKNLEIVKEFTVPESARSSQKRKKFKEMLDYLNKKSIKIILVEKVDRLTRNFKDAVKVNEWLEEDEERRVYFAKQNLELHKNAKSQEKFRWNIQIVMAQNFIDNLSEEVKKGQKEKLEQGYYPAKSPLGYKTVGEKKEKKHVIDEEVAPFIKKMFKLYASGDYTTRKLVDKMYEEGLRSRKGNKIKKSRIHGMLRDCFYYGKMSWKGEEYPAKHEGIVSEQLWNKVQRVLERENSGGKYRKHLFYLRGLIKCDECGYSITAEEQKGYTYYHCTGYDDSCTNNKYVREETVEEQLVEKLKEIKIKNSKLLNWVKKALKQSHSDKVDYHNKALKKLNKRYKKMQDRLDQLYDDKLDGEVDEDFYERKHKEYKEEQDEILEEIKKHKESDDNYLELGSKIIELAGQSTEIFEEASDEEKKHLVNLVFSDLSLDREELKADYVKPFEILANHAPAINEVFEQEETPEEIGKTGQDNPVFEEMYPR